MTTDRETIAADLEQFIRARSLGAQPLNSDTDLLGTGLLDSMLIIDLIAHVEKKHGVRIDDAEITPEHFRSISRAADLIARKRAE
jgi:acyl carrier protein